MKKVSKILHITMVVFCVLAISAGLIAGAWSDATVALALLLWVGSDWLAELRCSKLQQEIDSLKSEPVSEKTAELAKSRKPRKPKTTSTTNLTTPTTDAK
jgi:hypothetical protein